MKAYSQSLRIFKTKSIFFKILFFLVITIFVSIIFVGYISYYYSSNLLIKEVKDSNLLLIKQIGNDIDKDISNIERTTFQLSLLPNIKAALYSSGDDWSNDQILFADVIKSISSAKIANQSISELGVQQFKSDLVFTNQAKYAGEFYFQEVYKYKEGVNRDLIVKSHPRFVSLGRQKIISDFKERTVISFARGISVDDLYPTGMILANVDENLFIDTLNSTSIKNHIGTYILDYDGHIVLQNRNEQNININSNDLLTINKTLDSQDGYILKKIGTQEYLIAYSTSRICNWHYISIVPTEIITQKANKIRQITLVTAFVCLLIGICISLIITRRIYSPINEIISYINAFQIQRKLNEGKIEENELFFINRIISYVYNENKNLTDIFNHNIPVLKEKLLYDLLEGKYSEEDFYEDITRFDMAFPFPNYQVIVFEIEDYSAFNKVFKVGTPMEKRIDEIALENYHEDMLTYSLRRGTDKLVTIINSSIDVESSETIFEFVKETKDNFNDCFNTILSVGIGSTYPKISQVSMSLIDALSALKYKVVKGQGSITHIDEISELPEHIFEYSIETEKQLINLIKLGEIGSLQALVDEVVNTNLTLQKTSPEAVENLFNALAGTAIRTIYEVRSSVNEVFGYNRNIYKELLGKTKIQSKRELILEVYKSISRYIDGRKMGQGQKVLDKVMDYVEKNYSNDLSLAQVSENVGLSPAYLSSIFKDISGECFVDYINRVRIEKAKGLLLNSNSNISQIAEMVGFISSNTFIKVFKKHEGITPGQFRDTKM